MSRELSVLKAIIQSDFERHVKRFDLLKPGKSVLMIGDSMVAYFPINSLGLSDQIYNLGIPGDTTIGVLNRIEQAILLKPQTVIIHVGLNDLILTDFDAEQIYNNLISIAQIFKEQIHDVHVIIVNLTPINKSSFPKQMFVRYRNLHDADSINLFLKEQNKFKVIDLFSDLVDQNHELDITRTKDGIHLNDSGYKIYVNALKDIL